ncbi:MAG: pyridoxine 5'-phosphate synthase [Holosporales bacterium]
MSKQRIRLGLNIDHVATLRNARGEGRPDVLRAANSAVAAGADSITVHLREDRRHIKDADVVLLRRELTVPLNLEMAATEEMLEIACGLRPAFVCLVPENRLELTTEGGLDVAGQTARLTDYCAAMRREGISISLFVDADAGQIAASKAVGAQAIELHTGAYCRKPYAAGFNRLAAAAEQAHALGLAVHAGHGIDYDTAATLRDLPHLEEVNIGHFLMAEALFVGLPAALAQMRRVLDNKPSL